MIIAGLDIGNGYVKALLKNPDLDEKTKAVTIPSIYGTMPITTIDRLDINDDMAKENFMNHIYNDMIVSFDSNLFTSKMLNEDQFLIGERVIGVSPECFEFQLNTTSRTKSEDDISPVLILSILAAKAIEDYYKKNEHLPKEDETISEEASVAMSVPIYEYKVKRDSIVSKYLNSTHVVRVHNFEGHIIRVAIKFKSVSVVAEGAAAQFAIHKKGVPFVDALLKNLRKRGQKIDEAIDGNVVLKKAHGCLGIDIGDGTVNYPVYVQNQYQSDSSDSVRDGYGSVLDGVIQLIKSQPDNYSELRSLNSRKALAEWMDRHKDNIFKKRIYDKVLTLIKNKTEIFAKNVANHYDELMGRIGKDIDVVYVYGGGATGVNHLMEEALYNRLIALEEKNESSRCILYMDAEYSRFLNRDGLYYIAAGSIQNADALVD